MRAILTTAVLIGLTGCSDLPKDMEGTSDNIARRGVVRVGVSQPIGAEGQRFVAALGRAGRVAQTAGSLEPLIDALDHDRIDVIVAPFRSDSLLADEVALTQPLDGSEAGDRPVAVRAAVRYGENRWLMTVERLARAQGAK